MCRYPFSRQYWSSVRLPSKFVRWTTHVACCCCSRRGARPQRGGSRGGLCGVRCCLQCPTSSLPALIDFSLSFSSSAPLFVVGGLNIQRIGCVCMLSCWRVCFRCHTSSHNQAFSRLRRRGTVGSSSASQPLLQQQHTSVYSMSTPEDDAKSVASSKDKDTGMCL